MEIQGRTRGTQECYTDQAGGETGGLVINPRGDLQIAQALPGYADIVRMRNSYFVIAAVAVAPVVALPTTTAQMTLFNGELDSGRTYFVSHVGAFVAVSAGAATEIAVLSCMGIGKKATVVSDLTPKGLAGQRYRGAGLVDLAAAVTNDQWMTVCGSLGGAPASHIGMNIEHDVEGRRTLGSGLGTGGSSGFVIPPGHYFSIAVVANTVTTITVRQYIRWHEIQTPVTP